MPFDVINIKAVIFDWGGVIIDNPVKGMIGYFCSVFETEPAKLLSVYTPYQNDFERGGLSEEILWRNIARDLNREPPAEEQLWRKAFFSAYALNEPVLNLAKWLHKKSYKTALLSNTEMPTSKIYYDLDYNAFDLEIFSCVENLSKPDPAIYQLALSRLNVRPELTVFIDDKEENVAAANRLGMHGILFSNYDNLLVDLGVLLELSLSGSL